MNLHVQFVSSLQVCQVHQRGVEDDALRVADFGDRFDHGVKLCFTDDSVKDLEAIASGWLTIQLSISCLRLFGRLWVKKLTEDLTRSTFLLH